MTFKFGKKRVGEGLLATIIIVIVALVVIGWIFGR
jgi:hypothetical protein